MVTEEFNNTFSKAQSEFEEIGKNAKGQVGKRGFKYADLPTILKACMPTLHKYGFSLRQRFFYEEKVQFLEVKLCLKGECESSIHRIDPVQGGDLKDYGKKVTYLRRYMIQNLLGVCGDEEIDADFSGREIKFQVPTPKKKRRDAYENEEDYRGDIGDYADIF